MTQSEAMVMPFDVYVKAINYCWITYNDRRVGYNLNKALGDGKGSTGGKKTMMAGSLKHANIEKRIKERKFSKVPDYKSKNTWAK